MPGDAPRRIGIFGGTFDPPHIGHLVAAANALHALALHEVRFVVANDPWQKTAEHPVTPAADRVAMVAAAVADLPGATVCTLEIERGGPSYMADTLDELHAREPGAELFLLVGTDAALAMPTWERFRDLVASATIAVVDRPGEAGAEAPLPAWVAARVRIPLLDISSTELRRRVAEGEPLDYLVPPAVVSVIEERGLYREHPMSSGPR
jgi:nicotinate-nucleotide adenylyltransferase